MIRVSNLSFQYGESLHVFRGFDWQVERSDIWVVLGPSGCGKSTLLFLIAGLLQPNAGKIEVDSRPVRAPSPDVGLVLQDYELLPWATVRENASLGLRIERFNKRWNFSRAGNNAEFARSRSADTPGDVDEWLRQLGLAEVGGHYPGRLSGGQRQRTALARTLAMNPKLVLLDEPFGALDAPTREALQDLTIQLAVSRGLTAVLVTHSIEEAAFMGRRILVLGTTPQLRAHVIDNPGAGSARFRESAAFVRVCTELRAALDQSLVDGGMP